MKTSLLITFLFLHLLASAQTPLSYEGKLRIETDAAVIANLKRKGWQDAPKPSHNAATQHAPEWTNGGWIVRDLTQAELDAKQAATDDAAERTAVKAMIEKLKANTATAAEQRRCLIYLLRQLK